MRENSLNLFLQGKISDRFYYRSCGCKISHLSNIVEDIQTHQALIAEEI